MRPPKNLDFVPTLIRHILPVVFLSFLFQKCKDSPKVIPQKTIIKLDFAYALPVKLIFYSLIFRNSDTVYIKDYSPSQTDTSFYAVLTKEDRSKLDSLINDLNLSALDTSYDSGYIDGDEYNLTISKNDTLKAIYIHGGEVPGELRRLTDYVVELKEKLNPIFLDKKN